jgi:hypothetical protein
LTIGARRAGIAGDDDGMVLRLWLGLWMFNVGMTPLEGMIL